jgi:hypothetical protein
MLLAKGTNLTTQEIKMTAQLYVFPTRQTRAPGFITQQATQQADEAPQQVVDVRQHFAQLAAARDVDVANPYLTMVDGIDRLIAEIGLSDASHLIRGALRVRGFSVEVQA